MTDGECYQTKQSAIADTHAYMSPYNTQHIHTTIDNMMPVEFEKELNKVPGFIWPQHILNLFFLVMIENSQ